MPFRLRSRAPAILLAQQSEDEKRIDVRHDVFGYMGIASITIGTLLQIASVLVGLCSI
jgi:hypothetical protein